MAVVVPGFEEHEWAEDELQVLTDRGLTTIATHLDRFGRVRVAVDQNEQRWALKAVDYGSSELGHIQRLLDDPSPLNHTIPASLVPCKNAVIILMPRLHEVCEMKWQSLHEILECIGQMIEGALYMQDEMLSHFVRIFLFIISPAS
ncbi:hypothetical protein EW026_g3554 [Hermanssonia centrifuga]|uniref:Protein kinase domain-containing protein n=1 Tax=Hermanssonia centrifuga TaxID=98765 RepID=A0A4S4KJR0_9APHY|nr:hypothetical protein EW026_g3554 [Hermanssonia centrifuga]